ncbi:MAG: molybdate ABC transporter substrate-binding protein [Candidatus Margulisiibacteriota bacterium]
MKRSLLVISFLFLLSLSAFATEIKVAVAANLLFPFEEIKAAFEKETGDKVTCIMSSSGKLTAQIENGAPFDVFLSADMKYPNNLFKSGSAVTKPKPYAYGVLVLWTFNEIDLSKGIDTIKGKSIKKIALADPKTAPYGEQTIKVLAHFGLYDELKDKLVYGESLPQVNQFLETKAADIGFTAKSVVLAPKVKGKGKWIEVDPDSYLPIAQGAVILKRAKNNELAKAFYDFIFSEKAREIFSKYGYKLP